MSGANTSSWTGRPPTGKPINVGVIYIFTVSDGKVQSLKFESNQVLFMQQLGVDANVRADLAEWADSPDAYP